MIDYNKGMFKILEIENQILENEIQIKKIERKRNIASMQNLNGNGGFELDYFTHMMDCITALKLKNLMLEESLISESRNG